MTEVRMEVFSPAHLLIIAPWATLGLRDTIEVLRRTPTCEEVEVRK
jgi:hypothetical protein